MRRWMIRHASGRGVYVDGSLLKTVGSVLYIWTGLHPNMSGSWRMFPLANIEEISEVPIARCTTCGADLPREETGQCMKCRDSR